MNFLRLAACESEVGVKAIGFVPGGIAPHPEREVTSACPALCPGDQLPPDTLMNPDSVAEAYWYLYNQKRDAWSFELDVRPYAEKW